MKDQLAPLYLRMLELGFIVLKEAARSEKSEWVNVELELLHNIPSLVCESNVKRHLYFWEEERGYYLEKMDKLGIAEARSRCATYYEPIWEQMKPIVDAWRMALEKPVEG